jgi:KDO2-lipid IV(A) lauroyltransferase
VSLRQRLAYGALCLLREPFRRLPVATSLSLGAALGRLYAVWGGRRVEFARINLRIAFPEWSDAKRRRVLRESLANVGRSLAELALVQGAHREQVLSGVRIEGLGNLEIARARSGCKGVIVLTAHAGAWELAGMAAGQLGLPLSVVHRRFENPQVEAMVRRWREGSGMQLLPMGRALTGVTRALRRGDSVLMLIDQDAPRSEAVFADFFGVPAATLSAPAAIAMRTGASVVPACVVREGTGARHVVRLGEPLALEKGDVSDSRCLEANVAAMNGAVEAIVRAAPGQWSWLHRRWRTRPGPGEPGPYPSRRGRVRDAMPLPSAHGGSSK